MDPKSSSHVLTKCIHLTYLQIIYMCTHSYTHLYSLYICIYLYIDTHNEQQCCFKFVSYKEHPVPTSTCAPISLFAATVRKILLCLHSPSRTGLHQHWCRVKGFGCQLRDTFVSSSRPLEQTWDNMRIALAPVPAFRRTRVISLVVKSTLPSGSKSKTDYALKSVVACKEGFQNQLPVSPSQSILGAILQRVPIRTRTFG